MNSRAGSAEISSQNSRTPVNARVQDLLEQQAALRDLAWRSPRCARPK